MIAFLVTTAMVMLVLGLVSYLSSKRSSHRSGQSAALSLLPGDIKYESPGGKFRFYFPITTSIVISIILTLVLHFLR
jgi:ribose/xylose/arabinose/galactoside ABC-type transport system permease subunit